VKFLDFLNKKKSAIRGQETSGGRRPGARPSLERLEDRLMLSLTPLHISSNNRYLVDGNGNPFLIKGDAGWELIISTTPAEADQYLTARANQGFNLILVNLIDHHFGPNAPANMAGQYPFQNPTDVNQHLAFIDPPNEAYFAYADSLITAAADKGMYVLLDPSYLGFNGGEEGFYADMQAAGPIAMRDWGRYVGNRYKDYTNIVWMQGGDFNPPAAGRELVNQVALGIQENSSNLQTAHQARLSSAEDIWGNYSWLGLNSTYASELTYERSLVDYNRTPVSATFLSEDIYENEHGITKQQGRAEKYWNILSGSSGAIMGNCPIWGFDLNLNCDNQVLWQNRLNSQMATDMTRLGQLFAHRDWYNLVPDQGHTTVTAGFGTFGNSDYVTAARTADGHLAMAYTPSAHTLTVDLAKLSGPVIAHWFDPTSGAYTTISGSPFPNSGTHDFTTPGNNSAGNGNGDWVLVLEAAPKVSLSLGGNPMTEAAGSATVTATIPYTLWPDDVTVNLAFTGTATNVTDYTRSGISISIPAGSTTGSVTLTAVQDTADEVNETIVVDINSVTNGTENGAQQQTATIADDDTVWDGLGVTNNWSEAANWSDNVVPPAGTFVVFNGTSSKNASVDAAFGGTVARLTIDALYGGTITLDQPLTVGSLNGVGNLNLGSNILTTGGDNSTTTFSGVISGTGGLTKNGTGSFYLSGNNSYDGVTTINNGSVLVSTNNALGSAAGGTNVSGGASARLVFERSVNYSTQEPVTIKNSGFNGIGALVGISNSTFAGPITLASASTIGVYPTGATFTLNGSINIANNALTVLGSGNITIGGVISGSGSLTKAGTGTMTLSNANTYGGSTTVNAGTLLVTGSISSSLTVNSPAVVGGTGPVGPITAASGTVTPGNGIGILSGSTADFSSGGTLRIQVQDYSAGTSFDRLDLTGSLTMGGTSKLTLDLAGLSTPGTAAGIALYGSRVGTFAPPQLLNNTNGFSVCLNYGSNSLDAIIQTGACFAWVSAGAEEESASVRSVERFAPRALSAGSKSVTVASLDSGIDYTHPALYRSIWINQGEIPAEIRSLLRDRDGDGRITMRDLNRRANQRRGQISDLNGNGFIDGGDLLQAWSNGDDGDGNGYVDDIIGWDFVNNDNDPMDDSGHGTHGAGVIVQVAPRTQLVPLKFLDSNAVGSLDEARLALDYALAQGVPISSNGWTASVFSQEWLDELRKAEAAGHLFVTAAGNGDPALLQLLGRTHLSNVLVVTATDANGQLASFSNWDPTIVDVAVPGVGVTSAMPGGDYAARSGTSVATAFAAGAAALVLGDRSTPIRAGVVDAILAERQQTSALVVDRASQHGTDRQVVLATDRPARLAATDEMAGTVDDELRSSPKFDKRLVFRLIRSKLSRRT
jgi:autotransporter-associated beta strand protein